MNIMCFLKLNSFDKYFKVIVFDFGFGVLIIEQQYIFNVYVLIDKYNKIK